MKTNALTVADLISLLQGMPQDYPVWVSSNNQAEVVHAVEWHDSVELVIEHGDDVPTLDDLEDFIDVDSLH